jgi:hypothetical protein
MQLEIPANYSEILRICDQPGRILGPAPTIDNAPAHTHSQLLSRSGGTTVIPTKSPKIHTGTYHQGPVWLANGSEFRYARSGELCFFFGISGNLPGSFLKSDRNPNWFVSDHSAEFWILTARHSQ